MGNVRLVGRIIENGLRLMLRELELGLLMRLSDGGWIGVRGMLDDADCFYLLQLLNSDGCAYDNGLDVPALDHSYLTLKGHSFTFVYPIFSSALLVLV